jgi:hypothetical protein
MTNQNKFVEDLKVVNKKKKLLLLSHIQSIKNLKYLIAMYEINKKNSKILIRYVKFDYVILVK